MQANLIFPVVITVAVVAQGFAFVPGAIRLANAQGWAVQPGIIVESKAEQTSTHRRIRRLDDPHQVGAVREVRERIAPERIAFEYEVAGNKLTGTRVSFFQSWRFGKLAPLYREGQVVVIYYDPSRPAESVLDRTADSGFYLAASLTIYALGMLAAAVLMSSGVAAGRWLLGGGFLVGVGMLLIVGTLLAESQRAPAELTVIIAFGGLPVLIGLVCCVTPWVRVPRWLVAGALVLSFVVVVGAAIAMKLEIGV